MIFNEKRLSRIHQQEVLSMMNYRGDGFRSSMESRIQVLSLFHGLDTILGMSFTLKQIEGQLVSIRHFI